MTRPFKWTGALINKPLLYESNTLDPYFNLATEEYLLRKVEDGQIVLYLWRNARTVVIGRNQDIFAEVNLEALKSIDGYPTRRISGGGAVYHDDGNLNFTFVCKSRDFDIPTQTEVVLNAVRSLGFDAEKTGRNDLCIEGRKFSGHSYYKDGDRCFHNGTILIRTDASVMTSVLTVSKAKLASKGVKSVRSRTVNLSELDPSVSLSAVVKAMKESFEKQYGPVVLMQEKTFDSTHEMLRQKFISNEWIYNRRMNWTSRWEGRSSQGNVTILMDVVGGLIRDCEVYSDALDPEFSGRVRDSLMGRDYKSVNFAALIAGDENG